MFSTSLNAMATAEPSAHPTGSIQRIVLAVDGTPESDVAVTCASRLAELAHARIQVVSVTEPMPASVSSIPPFLSDLSMPPVMTPTDLDALTGAQLKRVRDQLRRTGPASIEWSVAMRTGVMGSEVAEFASTLNADVIICGRGRHGVVDRLLGEEHLTHLLRTTRIPVLAVEPSLQIPSRRVIISVDFSAHNLISAQAALPFIADDATVYLVHVKPDPPFGIPHPGQWIRSYEEGVRAGLRRLQDELPFAKSTAVEPIVLNGHPGVALAEFARASRSELLTVGSQGAGFWNHLVIGSVTTYLLRAQSCSLLVVPER